MNPARFLVHLQFQQRASEFRIAQRECDALYRGLHAYPTDEEEALNAVIHKRIEAEAPRLDELYSQLHHAQQQAVGALGMQVQR